MYGAHRPADPGNIYWRIAHFMMPFWSITPAGVFAQHITARAWVPLDDTHTMGVAVRRKSERSVVQIPVGVGEMLPNSTDWHGRYRPVARAENDYLIDRTLQEDKSYTGIVGINLQDQAITESMGGITDHTFEHLAPSDEMITKTRRRLLRAARDLKKDGDRPPGADNPDAYFGARGGYYVASAAEDWLDIYRDNVAAAHRVQLAHAAE
jgi:phthalate 4,5-dioxygenase